MVLILPPFYLGHFRNFVGNFIFFDEADCLANGTLIAFLRQLRNGYVNRGRIPFVHSIALVGMRNIRDYKTRKWKWRNRVISPHQLMLSMANLM